MNKVKCLLLIMVFNPLKLHTDCFERIAAKISIDDGNNEEQNCIKPCEVNEIKQNVENKESITGSNVTKDAKNGTNQEEKSKKETDSKYFRLATINL